MTKEVSSTERALKLALEALELNDAPLNNETVVLWEQKIDEAITALREALAEQPAQPQQEPVAWMDGYRNIYSLEEKAAGCEDAVIPLVPAILQHWSDCAVHNEPAYPAGKCDCSGYTSPPTLSLAQCQRSVKPLTDRELRVIENKINPTMRWRSSDEEGITLDPIEYYELVRAIEAAHDIKENT